MSIIDSIQDKLVGWVFGKALVKAIASAAKLIVSYAIAKGISLNVVIGGIAINTQDELAMTVAINSALKMVFNWIKVKYPKMGFLP